MRSESQQKKKKTATKLATYSIPEIAEWWDMCSPEINLKELHVTKPPLIDNCNRVILMMKLLNIFKENLSLSKGICMHQCNFLSFLITCVNWNVWLNARKKNIVRRLKKAGYPFSIHDANSLALSQFVERSWRNCDSPSSEESVNLSMWYGRCKCSGRPQTPSQWASW